MQIITPSNISSTSLLVILSLIRNFHLKKVIESQKEKVRHKLCAKKWWYCYLPCSERELFLCKKHNLAQEEKIKSWENII